MCFFYCVFSVLCFLVCVCHTVLKNLLLLERRGRIQGLPKFGGGYPLLSGECVKLWRPAGYWNLEIHVLTDVQTG